MFYKNDKIRHIELLTLLTAILIVFVSYLVLWELGSSMNLKMDDVNSLSKSDLNSNNLSGKGQ